MIKIALKILDVHILKPGFQYWDNTESPWSTYSKESKAKFKLFSMAGGFTVSDYWSPYNKVWIMQVSLQWGDSKCMSPHDWDLNL